MISIAKRFHQEFFSTVLSGVLLFFVALAGFPSVQAQSAKGGDGHPGK